MAHNNKSNFKKTVASHKTGVGVGLAAIIAAAAGAYYLYGNDKGAARRQKLKSWTLRMKADVMEQIEELKEVNEEAYHTIVDKISDKYQQLKDVDPADVAALAARMRMHWKDIQRDITDVTSGTKARARSSAKPASSTTKKAKTVRARKVTKKSPGSNNASAQ